MTQDTRKDRRVKIVSLNVRYKSATVDEFIDNHALDVSRGGIYIKTTNPFSPGTLLKFEIRLASDQAVILGVGRVVWKRDGTQGGVGERPPGMGVKFIKIDDASKTLIDRLVNARADAGSAFESEPEAAAVARPGALPGGPAAATRVGPGPAGPPVRHGTIVGIGAVPSASGRPPADAGSRPPAGTIVSSRPPSAAAHRAPTGTILSSGQSPLGPMRPSGAVPSTGAPPTAMGANTPTGTLAVPGRPSTNPGIFPVARTFAANPPKHEQTVMRQAAELLEEALREAGGSMEDVGTNPLFSGTAAVAEAPPGRSPSGGDFSAVAGAGRGNSAPDEVEAERVDPAAHARAMVAAMAPAPPHEHTTRGDGGIVVPDPFGQDAPEGNSSRRISVPTPIDAHDGIETHGARRRATAAWLLFGAVAAIVIVGVAYSEQIFGTHAVPTPSAIPVSSPPSPSSITVGESAPPPTASAQASAAPSAASVPEASTASRAGAGAGVAPSQSDRPSDAASESAEPSTARPRTTMSSDGVGSAAPGVPTGAASALGGSNGAIGDPRPTAFPSSSTGARDPLPSTSARSSSHSSDDNPY